MYDNDWSTIISIVPVEINEFKPGIYPGNFHIDACEDINKPKLLHVTGSSIMLTVAGQRNPVAIESPSFIVAQAIVRDYNFSILARDGDSAPGIAFVKDKLSLEQILKDHPKVLPELKRVQRLWYVALCKMTDNDWARYKSHKAVSDVAKIAARALGLERDWLVDQYSADQQIKCKACYQMVDKAQPVCHHCSCILVSDEEVKKLGIKFAA